MNSASTALTQKNAANPMKSRVARSSSRRMLIRRDGRQAPTLCAPGENVTAPRAPNILSGSGLYHQISGTSMEIRSAGPDRVLWTLDDVIQR